jgi:hypothetical protein
MQTVVDIALPDQDLLIGQPSAVGDAGQCPDLVVGEIGTQTGMPQ